ncbi:hypothetical protein SK128_004872 [Halocaridina rubra]|uniref:Peptidase S1 domain-containing protein n=1 Tax=Halocaridina rubra TaxID=373956 RepID=A0AAN8XT00_HALRR
MMYTKEMLLRRGLQVFLVLTAFVQVVLLGEEKTQLQRSSRRVHSKLHSDISSDYKSGSMSSNALRASARLPKGNLQEHNSPKKNERNKGFNRRRDRMKIKSENSPKKRLPPFIRRVVPLIAMPAQKGITKKSKKNKMAKCGRAYDVGFGKKFTVRLKKAQNCNIIFRPSKNTSLKLVCPKIKVGNCTEGDLVLSDGGRLNTKNCGETSTVKVKTKMLTELFMSYELKKSPEIKIVKPNVTCRIKGKKGPGYIAKGLQRCPQSCGKTRADAGAHKPLVTVPVIPSSTGSPTSIHTTTQMATTTTAATPEFSTTSTSVTLTEDKQQTHLSYEIKTTQMPSVSTNKNLFNTSVWNVSTLQSQKYFSQNHAESVRIQGGNAAHEDEWPWMVYIKVIIGGSLLPCGGTVVSSRYILTAAHCVFDVVAARGDRIVVVANEYNIRNKTETITQKKSVSKIHLHPKYNSSTQVRIKKKVR